MYVLKERKHVWQNSWGLTTRTIGVMVMVHGDDKGLVLPPRVAPIQAVIIWIYATKTPPTVIESMKSKCEEINAQLKEAGVRVVLDKRDDKNPGWKYAHWEQKGVCIRIEMGPRDFDAGSVVIARRDNGAKIDCKWDNLVGTVTTLLETIQKDMLAKARAERDAQKSVVMNFSDFHSALDKRHIVLTPWCNTTPCEELVKDKTGPTKEDVAAAAAETGDAEEAKKRPSGAAKTLCIPFDQDPLPAGTKCFNCEKFAEKWTLWGRSY
jgi:prolyl-tRNA synthetase